MAIISLLAIPFLLLPLVSALPNVTVVRIGQGDCSAYPNSYFHAGDNADAFLFHPDQADNSSINGFRTDILGSSLVVYPNTTVSSGNPTIFCCDRGGTVLDNFGVRSLLLSTTNASDEELGYWNASQAIKPETLFAPGGGKLGDGEFKGFLKVVAPPAPCGYPKPHYRIASAFCPNARSRAKLEFLDISSVCGMGVESGRDGPGGTNPQPGGDGDPSFITEVTAIEYGLHRRTLDRDKRQDPDPEASMVDLTSRQISRTLKMTANAVHYYQLILLWGAGAMMITSTAKHKSGYSDLETQDQSPSTKLTIADPATVVTAQQVQFAMNLLTILGLGITKLSVLSFYHRVFCPQKIGITRIIIVGMICIVSMWTIAFWFGYLFICGVHFSVWWGPSQGILDQCIDALMFDYACTMSDLVTDVVILLIPLPPISLESPTENKVVGASAKQLVIMSEAINTSYNLSSLDRYTRIREMNNNPTRVIIKAHLRDIPAETKQRVHRLGSDFCEQMLGRPINIQVQQGGYDAMHFLPGFDSAIRNDENISRYFIYDFNVTGRLDKEELLGIEHKFYLATRIGDSWIFTPREGWVNSSRSYASRYVWGGVGEQKILSSIKSQ
ncbi:hypothetical protein G7Y89_g8486 [Cudoniella acicularis]|uniref:Rhodopsin domain-containing protein n=1 Tax=Cudoniella acicularis TaxID=354080 RepID=A0A8H4RGG8_9HELO|nr:hypothetical protein G7Y89_g8486 [Cudoniella acicularis]